MTAVVVCRACVARPAHLDGGRLSPGVRQKRVVLPYYDTLPDPPPSSRRGEQRAGGPCSLFSACACCGAHRSSLCTATGRFVVCASTQYRANECLSTSPSGPRASDRPGRCLDGSSTTTATLRRRPSVRKRDLPVTWAAIKDQSPPNDRAEPALGSQDKPGSVGAEGVDPLAASSRPLLRLRGSLAHSGRAGRGDDVCHDAVLGK